MVAARRSTSTYSEHGKWYPSATEGVEVGEMAGTVDLVALGRRGCVEELGVVPVSVVPWRWQQVWSSGWSTRLYLLATTPLSLEEVRVCHAGAVDGHESDALAVAGEVTGGPWGVSLLRPDLPGSANGVGGTDP